MLATTSGIACGIKSIQRSIKPNIFFQLMQCKYSTCRTSKADLVRKRNFTQQLSVEIISLAIHVNTFRKMATSKLNRDEVLLLFDVDGTLTFPRSVVEPEFEQFMYTEVKPRATIGIVGGSDLEKMFEQLNGKKILEHFDFVFPENGLVVYERGVEVSKQNIIQHLGEATLQRFINFVLRYLADLELPIKRGTFIEFRNGMLNVCPIGRQCTREERNMFAAYDQAHKVREKMINVLRDEFVDVDLTYSIGGQISFDVFPIGWDKTYSLRHIEANYKFKEIHFFGDKTEAGGNDHEIFIDPRTIGHKVSTPHDTKRILSEIFGIN